MINCINLFPFSLCLALLHSFSLSLFCLWRLGSLQANERGGKKSWNNINNFFVLIQSVTACQGFDLETLFLTFSTSAVHLRREADCFNPNLLSVCSVALFLLNMNSLPTVAFAAVFSQEQNRTQIARGNLKWEALKSTWKKKRLYLATHSAINPVMVQLPLSKRGLKASRQATTQLSANSLHPFCQQGKKPNKAQLHWIALEEPGWDWTREKLRQIEWNVGLDLRRD